MLATLSLVLSTTLLVAPDTGSAMFRGGALHLGAYPAAKGSYAGIAWRVQTGGPVRSSPVVVGNTVYVGSTDGRVYALDAASGAVRWQYDAGSSVSATPAVAGGVVVIEAIDGSVHGISQTTGRRNWRIITGTDARLAWGYESGDNWTSSPTVIGNMVLVGSGDGALYALDLATGRTRWKAATRGRIRSTPAVSGDQVVVGSFDGHVYSFDRTSGKEKWRFATDGVNFASDTFGYDRKSIQSSPAIAGDLVLAGARDGYFYGIDLATGKERWRVDHKISWVNCSPAIADGMAFIGSSDAQFLQAVDLKTGAERWRADTLGVIWASPSVAGNVVYTPTTRGPLYAFDKSTGKELWRVRFGGGTYSSPTIAGDRLYIGNDDGSVYALDLTAPAPLRRMVYFDQRFEKLNFFSEGTRLRDYLLARGYQLIDASQVVGALATNRASNSVIVFAQDYLQPELAGSNPASGQLRQYLAAGGRVVWPGVPPLIWPRDTLHEDISLLAVNRKLTQELLGVSHQGANFDGRPVATVTPSGKAWGLSGWFTANWAADPAAVSEVLALDDQGNAAAWTQRYGNAGGMFVRVPLPTMGEAMVPVFSVVQRAAEKR